MNQEKSLYEYEAVYGFTGTLKYMWVNSEKIRKYICMLLFLYLFSQNRYRNSQSLEQAATFRQQ